MSKKQQHKFYREYPKTCDADDYWGQVKRTINGKPLPEAQINLMINAIRSRLDLNQSDHLLDLCCGNGALTTSFKDDCKSITGVDFSEPLIEVAQRDFNGDNETYHLCDVIEFCQSSEVNNLVTKILCYGSIAYMADDQVQDLLSLTYKKFPQATHFLIGNCPDKDKADEYFKNGKVSNGIISDLDSPIGIWRDEAAFLNLANNTGWQIQFLRMPKEFMPGTYRYDALLSRVMSND